MGAVVSTTDYDPYGARINHTGASDSEIGYTSAWTDPLTQLVYLRARDYDASTMQFLVTDPLVTQTRERYTYVGNSPLHAFDPSGLCVGLPDSPQDRLCTANDYFWNESALNAMGDSIGSGIGVNLANLAFGIGDAATSTAGLNPLAPVSATGLLREAIGGVDCVIPENGFYTFGLIWGSVASGSAAAGVVKGATSLPRLFPALADDTGAISAGAAHTADEAALHELATQAKQAGGVTKQAANILTEWATELGWTSHPPLIHLPRVGNLPSRFGELVEHITVGNVRHIPVIGG